MGNLYSLYFAILSHEDNPATVWKDYWSVKAVYGDELDGEFAALVAEMDEALARYEADYGGTVHRLLLPDYLRPRFVGDSSRA